MAGILGGYPIPQTIDGKEVRTILTGLVIQVEENGNPSYVKGGVIFENEDGITTEPDDAETGLPIIRANVETYGPSEQIPLVERFRRFTERK